MRCDLLFDLDQTLLDFHASERLALKAVMEAADLTFSEERYAFFKKANKALWLDFEKGLISKPGLFKERFRRLFEKCGCYTDGIDLMQINSDFIDIMSRNGVLMEGVPEFLQKLETGLPDARLYIVTNGAERNAMGRINSTGLSEHLDGVFVSETIGTAKPAREYFEQVIKAIGDPRECCIVIGDSLTSDMLGAQNAGLTSCWFMPQGDIPEEVKKYDIDRTASSFGELYEVLKEFYDKLSAGERDLT
ncbi:MAG: YjjG family noncanonical pyrimidine nucleotidase [Ruminococcus sp.]|nr:YjjG family noncanonical pyrimidine nucleotidase [Ruminococcus sp.]MBR6874601.1 YjjG family noncanonical pyrimidine nucleotidase [Ruminococcus sp.]